MHIGLAGTTERTVKIADILRQQPGLVISWVMTPPPKPIGRKQIITPSPMQNWAETHSIPVVTVTHKIDSNVKSQLDEYQQKNPIDILLVVDFGYLISQWLLDLPKIAPLNIHPSDLPRWRGSSPAQFSLLHGDQESAVTLMVMSPNLDDGDIIAQVPFKVETHWTSQDYYQASFDLLKPLLNDWLTSFAQGKITATPQPTASPTPIARRLTKADSFVAWETLEKVLQKADFPSLAGPSETTSELLEAVAKHTGDWAQTLERACRAFLPWPGLWTMIPTTKGNLRMKILALSLDPQSKIVLEKVQLEGKNPSSWEAVKTSLT